MGFLRVSMSPGFGAAFEDALVALQALTRLKKHRFVVDQTRASDLAAIAASRDVTDAHLIRISVTNGLKLATLDKPLCQREWAAGVAFHPF